ncbi:hypothetical protein [Candidatus Vesicomyidisocius calyptogenae]|uniref:Uncharacterized protein n=1 Tax=Vesicomyosocius okutanii subsp. Calyptogena okutanii (strain HA) TaxID=412965 RepID=A5CWW2_VESOH|nr:hypothetical protein [Candidatus Vesicomyosocius okutanii]BAF61539.1 hypothetical protein COSY_0420 [Candidatus Vesicomyosocius okutanii]
MIATSQHSNELSAKRIVLQNTFKAHTQVNGFSYKDWINPPAGSFYEGYKKKLDEINNEMAPPLTYQS